MPRLGCHAGQLEAGVGQRLASIGAAGLFFVTHDFYIYCFHRLQHRSNLLWRTHAAHHSVDDVDWLSGTRSHALEITINQTIEFLPIVLLGAAPEVALMKATIDAVWGMYIHSNLNVRSGVLQRVINGPEMHRWHHARELEMPGQELRDQARDLGLAVRYRLPAAPQAESVWFRRPRVPQAWTAGLRAAAFALTRLYKETRHG